MRRRALRDIEIEYSYEGMKKIVFATNKSHKLDELRAIAAGRFEVLSLADIDCHDDIPETADTLEGNALQKARYVKQHFGYDCFADDTGLMVDALDGAPGVYSARYAGPGHDSAANMAKLLSEMEGKTDRRARFVTVIALIEGDRETTFEGCVEGRGVWLRPGVCPRRGRRPQFCVDVGRGEKRHLPPRPRHPPPDGIPRRPLTSAAAIARPGLY